MDRWTRREESAYKVLVGISETTMKTSHRWEDIIKMDLKEMGREGVDYIHLLRIGTNGVLLCAR
jgi:hypothetical protein